jgi:hypothetical protein
VIDIDVCDDGVTCLKIDGAEASYAAATIAILRLFLYPESHTRGTRGQ